MNNCQHCGLDIVAHHARNLRCPTGRAIYREAKESPLKSFDDRVWAHAFVEQMKLTPGIAVDEETMTTWFANALMRGYDEHRWQSKDYKRSIRRILVPWWKRFAVPLRQFGH